MKGATHDLCVSILMLGSAEYRLLNVDVKAWSSLDSLQAHYEKDTRVTGLLPETQMARRSLRLRALGTLRTLSLSLCCRNHQDDSGH